jgi:type IV pilus assembly protein PilE
MLLSRYSREAILLRGFTLIEIMITVLIIAILAAIMTPQFTRYVEKGRGEEGKLMLKSIRAAEKIYKSDNTTYTNNMNNLIPHIGRPNSDSNRSFDYTIPSASSTTFTARATRRQGTNQNEYITIDDTGVLNPNGTDTWNP